MIKQTITYHTHDDEEVTEEFYFHLDKLEILEMEMQHEGGIEAHIKTLTETSNGLEAYHLFKNVILDSYGKRVDKKFVKKDPVTRLPYKYEFEDSPALGELIFSFVEDANRAATFINGLIPAHEIRAAQERALQDKETDDKVSLDGVAVEASPVKKADGEPTDEELLKMKPQEMTPEQLQRAYMLKSTPQQ